MPTRVSTPPLGTTQDVDAYLANVPEPARTTLLRVRATILAESPKDATEGFSYGVPAVKLKKGAIGGYAAYREFCSYYPMSGRVITKLAEELKGYTTSSGAIRFPINKPLSKALVHKLVQARLAELAAK